MRLNLKFKFFYYITAEYGGSARTYLFIAGLMCYYKNASFID